MVRAWLFAFAGFAGLAAAWGMAMPAAATARVIAVRIVGLMSGTSYDAIEVAAAGIEAAGDTLELTPLGAFSVAYDDGLRDAIAAVLPPRTTTIEAVCRLDTRLGQAFAAAAAEGVARAGGAELIVSHGQTVFHWVEAGRARGTLQLGAPAWIAERTGLPVLSDLRTADIARGGQGAPLVPAFDALLLAGAGDGVRAALNLGGIANLTVVRPGREVIGYDVGPANALLDAAAQRFHNLPYDVDGRGAARGRVDPALLATLLAEPYYAAPPPKSTGKELFSAAYLSTGRGAAPGASSRTGRCETGLSGDDVLATLTELTARVAGAECDRHGVTEVFVSGGGTRNPVLMTRLAANTRAGIRTTTELGIPPEAKEAYAFAVLGWLAWYALPGAIPSVTGARAASVLGNWTPGATALCLPAKAAHPPRRLVIKV
jgi:anhydro-N-acetylmuramic acid kinase